LATPPLSPTADCQLTQARAHSCFYSDQSRDTQRTSHSHRRLHFITQVLLVHVLISLQLIKYILPVSDELDLCLFVLNRDDILV